MQQVTGLGVLGQTAAPDHSVVGYRPIKKSRARASRRRPAGPIHAVSTQINPATTTNALDTQRTVALAQ
jgi:hypothetical protein